MTAPRVLVLRAPGTNCDFETAHAFALAGGAPERVHVNRLVESPRLVSEYQILCVPGGFSFGDDLGAGRILASKWRSQLAESLREFHDAGRLILGICNGFQVLIQTGMLLAEDSEGPVATLTWNQRGRFEARWVHLSVASDKCVFLQGMDRFELPVAHAEGRFVARSPEVLADLDCRGQLVLRYCRPDAESDGGGGGGGGAVGNVPLDFPWNPNGSQANVAGVCDTTGRVFGLMPHPERFVDYTQHPRWTRESVEQPGAGLRLFINAVAYFR